jgi:hypothetical protein
MDRACVYINRTHPRLSNKLLIKFDLALALHCHTEPPALISADGNNTHVALDAELHSARALEPSAARQDNGLTQESGVADAHNNFSSGARK